MKIHTLAIITLAALIAMSGCKKNDIPGTIVKASIGKHKSGYSKTSLVPISDTEAEIHWTMGDQILVNNGTDSQVFTLYDGANSKTGIFNCQEDYTFGDDNVAVYPAANATISGTTVSMTLPATQTLTGVGTFGNGANPMACTFSNPNSLTFTSLCGVLGLGLTGNNVPITGIEVVSKTEGEKLNGAFVADLTDNQPTLTSATGNNGTNSVMLSCNTTLTETAKNFYIVLPVGTLSQGFTLNVYNGSTTPIFSTGTDNDITIAWNMVNMMPSLEVTATLPIPTGAINGLFTINQNGDQVYFSQGNLQYIGSAATPYWKFAENQWDYLGTTTGQNSSAYNVDRDLFGWGTSGYNHGAVAYQPWSTSQGYSDYFAYGEYTYNLYDQTGQADWGYNAISNGGNTENSGWRTLTGGSNGEWAYIFNTRTASTVNGVANARFAKAKVANVHGVILFPDSYTHPTTVAQPVGINETGSTGWDGNNYSADDFALMQANGAVFLPAAGLRNGTSVSGVGSYGFYCSASYDYDDYGFACDVSFYSGDLDPMYRNKRYYGQSVRLVHSPLPSPGPSGGTESIDMEEIDWP